MSVSSGRTGAELAGIVGGYAPLDSGLLVPRAYLPQIAGLLHNMSASTGPTVNDDSGDGYGVGSRWLDTTNDVEYVCLDAGVGAAVWFQTTVGGTWAAFTPSWTGSGSNPTLGSSTISGRYKMLGSKTCVMRIVASVTTGGAWNAGSGSYRFSLPFTAAGSPGFQALDGWIIDSGSSYFKMFGMIGTIASDRAELNYVHAPNVASATGSAPVSNVAPMTPATGDAYVIQGVYEIA